MEEKRLPRNLKEGLIYGGTICLVTVFIMLFFNVGITAGINLETIKKIFTLAPFVWIIAMLVESFLVGKIAEKLVEKFTEPTDSFNTKILFNILFCVTGMSAIMTILGGMVGMGKLSLEPIVTFPSHWPRNFCVAFWCEILLAQPLARYIMRIIHKKK